MWLFENTHAHTAAAPLLPHLDIVALLPVFLRQAHSFTQSHRFLQYNAAVTRWVNTAFVGLVTTSKHLCHHQWSEGLTATREWI